MLGNSVTTRFRHRVTTRVSSRARACVRDAIMRSVQAGTTRTICQARLRSGAPCRQIVPRGGDSQEFCPTHAAMLAGGVSADALRAGKQPGGQRHKPPKAAARLVRAESNGDAPEANDGPLLEESAPAEGG